MRFCLIGVFTAAFCLTQMVSSSMAQEPPSDTTIQRELAELRIRADEGLTLMKELISQKQEENRLKKLQVAVLALQLRSSSIGDIQKRIRTLEDRLAETKEVSAQMLAETNRIEEMISADSTADAERNDLRATKKQLDTQVELVNERIWELERQIIDLQNELSAKRREIDSLEATVIEGLSNF